MKIKELEELLFQKSIEISCLKNNIHNRNQEVSKLVEEKFHYLYNNAPAMVHSIDKNAVLISVSDIWLENMGYLREEVIGRKSTEFLSDKSKQYAHEIVLPEFMIKGYCDNIEYQFVRKDGRIIEVLLSAIIEKDDDGKMIRSLAIINDVTKRKKIESELLESKQKYYDLLNTIRGIIWEADPNTNQVTFISKQVENILGYSASEWLDDSRFWEKHLHPDDKKWVIEFYENSLNKLESHDFEYRMIAANGKVVWLHDFVYIEKGESSKLNGIMVDITETKQSLQKSKITEAQYSNLFNLLKDGVYRSTPEGKFLDVNPAMVKMFGYESREEMLGIDIAKDLYLNDGDRGILISNPIQDEFQLKRKDGSRIWVEDHDHYIKDEYNNVIIHEGIMRDVSERKKAEAEIQLLLNELSEKNAVIEEAIKEKDKIFSVIAHDLKSPFSGFLGLTKILSEKFHDLSLSELKEINDALKYSAENLYSLIENLLEWAMMQRGSVYFEPEKYSLNYVINTNLEIFKVKSNLKRITLLSKIEDNLEVIADMQMLNGIIRNLISNAIKFTRNDGTITIDAKENAENIEISIKDNGIGIPEDILQKLFIIGEKTSRLGTEDESSTGLGLVLCKEYVQRHNGNIWVESKEDLGTTFFFTLPKNSQ